jgi:hypothetical protein
MLIATLASDSSEKYRTEADSIITNPEKRIGQLSESRDDNIRPQRKYAIFRLLRLKIGSKSKGILVCHY